MRHILQRACVVLGLWAITSSGAVAGANAEALGRALRWLEAQQDPADGAWHGASAVATMLQTTAAVDALQMAGQRSAAWYAGQAWLGNHEANNTDSRARRLRAMRVGAVAVQDEVDTLLRGRNGNGWGLAARYQRDPLDSALALAALWHVGSTFDLRDTADWLQGVLAAGANWPVGTTAPTPGITALLLGTLAPVAAANPALAQTLRNRLASLAPAQLANASVTVRVLASLAWQALLPEASESRLLLSGLREAQAASGALEDNVMATALLAQALARAEAPMVAASGERVAIGDLALRLAINDSLGRGALDQLTRADLARLTALDLDGRGVRSLRGLEYAVNLRAFSAGDSPIADLSPLAGLPGLGKRRAGVAVEAGAVSFPDGESESAPQQVPLLPAPAGWLLPLGIVFLMRRARAAGRISLALAGFAFAAQLPTACFAAEASGALAPQVLESVSRVSHRLLQAHAKAPEGGADHATLETTAALVAELESAIGRVQHVASQGSLARGGAGWSSLSPATVDRARAVITRLRQAPAPPMRSVAANGPAQALVLQRSALFRRWASDLEATLAPDVPDRLARLSGLRRRLQLGGPGIHRPSPSTPTLQALPAPRQ